MSDSGKVGEKLSPMAEPLTGFTADVVVRVKEKIANELIAIAKSQVGVRENGFNKGKDVEKYQRVIGRAEQEAWCLAFMQWVVQQWCNKYGIKNPLHPTEHCQTLFNNTPEKYRRTAPAAGLIFIQKSYTSQAGHTGICTGGGAVSFPTIEGNTDSGGSSEGDGVYIKSRLRAGTASKFVRGYIDVVTMLFDSTRMDEKPVDKPVEKPGTSPALNVKGDWNANLDSVIMDMVTPELINLPYARMKKFMPAWDVMNTAQRKRFFADLLFAMCRYESNYDRMAMYHEDTLGVDAMTGLPVISEGLLQLSYQDAKWYNITTFDYIKDAKLLKADWLNRGGKKSWRAQTDRTILGAENNVKAAMVIMIKLLTNPKLKNEEFADTIGRYWACMKRYKNGKYREMFLGICKILKEKGYKT